MKLPIDDYLDAITSASGNLIISAEPGAGKTTRVPVALGSDRGQVVVLEPRRLAARMAARRVAEEQKSKLGDAIGYTVRFEDRSSRHTRVRFVTEGIFVRLLAGNPSLEGIDTIVFDEFHERHLDSDLALALTRELGTKRIVVMSATLDAAPLATFLDAEVISVPGRTHPVAIEHHDVIGADLRVPERKVASHVRRVLREEPDGDVLVFLPGAADIRRCREACESVDADVVVLHGDLDGKAQDRAVRPGARRKVILSTNLAESSVTIEGIIAVVDSGLAREARVSPYTGLSSLETVRISQASAKQRAGRAGRMRPGRCVRLYDDLRSRPAQAAPEIERGDLCAWWLQMRARGRSLRDFPFFEAPPSMAIDAAEDLLRRLGAFEGDSLSADGETMLRLPVHPRLGKLVAVGRRADVGPRACLIAALAQERDVRRSFDREASDEVGSSDLLASLESVEAAEAEGLRDRELHARGLDARVFRTVLRSRDQLCRAIRLGPSPERSLDDEEADLRRAIVQAFPDRVGKRKGRDQITFSAGKGLVSGQVAESSVVREAEWVVVTGATDMRGRGGRGTTLLHSLTAIDPDWLIELFTEDIDELDELVYDASLRQVVRKTGLRYDGLVLDESVQRDPSGDEVGNALAEAIFERGIEKLFDADELEAHRRRVEFARKRGFDAPGVDDAAIRRALRALCAGHRTIAGLHGSSLVDVLRLDLGDMRAFDRFVPSSVALPGRKRCPVSYEIDRDPWIASRIQDFFGMAESPTIADGVPLVLHLLAPNRRAVQVTTDLAGFWKNHYPRLRIELKRRYHKHSWPEDPTQR